MAHPGVFGILPAWPLLAAFLVASLALALTPGPSVFYIVTRSLVQGRRHGLASVAGVALGNLGNATGAALGLAALFQVSALAFTVVRYVGAVYLIAMGVMALRRHATPRGEVKLTPHGLGRIFRDGFMVALFNPKTAIFFAAFLPQFMDRSASHLVQSVALGALFVVIAGLTDTLYALTAGGAATFLQRSPMLEQAARTVGALSFIGLGLFTAFGPARAGAPARPR